MQQLSKKLIPMLYTHQKVLQQMSGIEFTMTDGIWLTKHISWRQTRTYTGLHNVTKLKPVCQQGNSLLHIYPYRINLAWCWSVTAECPWARRCHVMTRRTQEFYEIKVRYSGTQKKNKDTCTYKTVRRKARLKLFESCDCTSHGVSVARIIYNIIL